LKLGGIGEEGKKASTAVAPGGPAERHQGEGGEQEDEREEAEFSRHPQSQLEEALPLFLPLSAFSSFPLHQEAGERAKEVYSQGYIHCMP
jgi:hypothetical protein